MHYSKDYSIHYYNSDIHLNASITSLLRMMEDIGVQQSEERGVGLNFYKTSQVAWMLIRWKVDFLKLPKFKDILTLRTTPKAFRGYYANRECRSSKEFGQKVVNIKRDILPLCLIS